MSEATILFCTIFGTLIAYLAYKSSTSDVLKETKQLLLEKFDFLQRLNSKLIDDLNEYGKKNNTHDTVFMQGLTLNQCISIAEQVKYEILTTENYNAIKNANSKMRLDDITKKIEAQIQHHSEVRTTIDYFISPSLATRTPPLSTPPQS